MKGGINKVFWNLASLKGKSDIEKVIEPFNMS